MDRINKFLDARPQKHVKTIKYKEEKFTLTKDDLKKVRAYRSGKCLDPAIKSIPNRMLSTERMEAMPERPKRDLSDYFNNKLKERYRNNPRPTVIEAPKNTIVDVWEDEGLDTLKLYTQEWTYSINTPYEGRAEELEFTRESLEQEMRRVYMKQFTPRDPKKRSLADILPKIPSIPSLRPFPEQQSFEWEMRGRKFMFNGIAGTVSEKRVRLVDMRYNKVLFDHEFDEEMHRMALHGDSVVVSSRTDVYQVRFMESGTPAKILHASGPIKDIYIDESFICYITTRSIHLHDRGTLEEMKVLRLKGDTPHSMRIDKGVVYASTHKGIMVDSSERSEIKNLGYVVDFEISNGYIYALNNLGRLMIVDEAFKVVGSTAQSEIGQQIKIHPAYGLIAVVFSAEIWIYKAVDRQCIPVHRIPGEFRAVSWDAEMPWLFAGGKSKTVLFS